jgi:8-oxo-dGTP pyrophosphatase MutT (NUDIX family)
VVGAPSPWHSGDSRAASFTTSDVRAVVDRVETTAWDEGANALVNANVGATGVPAAVLVALFDVEARAHVILTKRPETMPNHRGEIAFPGGKFDPSVDRSLIDTALREAYEEVALAPEAVEVVGTLRPLATASSTFVITPFVGIVAEGRPTLRAHPREVVAVFDVSIDELLHPDTYRNEQWSFPSRGRLDVHFYELEGETVWGATARILTDLLTRLTAPRPPR